MNRFAVPLLILASCTCDRGGVTPDTGELEVTPLTVDFGRAFVGFPIRRPVVVKNPAKADHSAVLTLDGPFRVEASELVVPGASELTVQITFAPLSVGPVSGKLLIVDGDLSLEVALTGSGEAALTCTASAPCHVAAFDAASGLCVETLSPDGTGCESACLTGGTCASGTCIGTAIDCNDSNQCTLDACDARNGCSHTAVSCAAPSNPCKVGRCDPALGCAEADVRDGTSCGPADCVTAKVCLLGACQTLAVPDGAKCAEATPCQGAGSCQQSVCVKPAATVLPEAWHYRFPGIEYSFRGVSDAQHHLYWLECTPADCAAVSYTRDGVLRFRAPLGFVPLGQSLMHLLAGDQLVWASGARVGAVSTVDGAPRWSLQLPAALPGAPDVADPPKIVGLAAAGNGLLVATATRTLATASRSSVFLAFTAPGALLFTRYFDEHIGPPVLDELDHVFVGINAQLPPFTQSLVSLDTSGAESWRVPALPPLAAFGTDIMLSDGQRRSALDGSLRAAAPGGALLNNVLMTPAGQLLLRYPLANDRIEALAFRPGVTGPAWTTDVTFRHGGNWTTDTVLTRAGHLMLAAGDTRHPSYLMKFDELGAPRFSCQVDAQILDEPVALLDGRWVMLEGENSNQSVPTLRAYDVPGETAATHGWTGAQGSAAGSRRALP